MWPFDMSNLSDKVQEYLKGKPTTPTPKRDNTTEAYFSADRPLEGDRDSDVMSWSSGAEDTEGNDGNDGNEGNDSNDSNKINTSKSGADKLATQLEEPAHHHDSEEESDSGSDSAGEQPFKGRNRSASDVLLSSDLRDVGVMSTMMREMNEKSVSEEEKLSKLLEMQKSREGEREAQKKGDGRYLGMV